MQALWIFLVRRQSFSVQMCELVVMQYITKCLHEKCFCMLLYCWVCHSLIAPFLVHSKMLHTSYIIFLNFYTYFYIYCTYIYIYLLRGTPNLSVVPHTRVIDRVVPRAASTAQVAPSWPESERWLPTTATVRRKPSSGRSMPLPVIRDHHMVITWPIQAFDYS